MIDATPTTETATPPNPERARSAAVIAHTDAKLAEGMARLTDHDLRDLMIVANGLTVHGSIGLVGSCIIKAAMAREWHRREFEAAKVEG